MVQQGQRTVLERMKFEGWDSLTCPTSNSHAPLKVRGVVGSLMYMAPEVWRRQEYDEKVSGR